MIYLDHASTTPLCQEAREAMRPWLEGSFLANPSSLHEGGRRARQVVEDCREEIAQLLHCRSRDVIFTSGATEANTLALRGPCLVWKKSRGLAVSQLEHPSIIENAEQLAREGVDVVWISPDKTGAINWPTVEKSLTKSTGLVVTMLANNEIGHVTDVASIAHNCQQRGLQIHCDATQGVGHLPVNYQELGVDTLSLSGHKIGGPMGVGVLIARRQASLAAVQRGGTQELGRRAGTENLLGIIGLTAALRESLNKLETRQTHWLRLRQRLEEQLAEISGTVFNSTLATRLPHLVNVSFKGIAGEALLIRLDMEGICLSSGSACHADDPEPSHVLKALGRSRQLAAATLRFSFGPQTTREELDGCVHRLKNLIAELRSVTSTRQG